MESLNSTTYSTIRTDYGSTTFKISIDNNSLKILDSEAGGSSSLNSASSATTCASSSTAYAVGYQSQPYTSSTNLYTKSSLKSRFSKMTVDTMPNSETRQIVQRFEYFLNVVNQICIGFVTIYMCWVTLRTGLAGTGLHAFLVTIGVSSK